MVIGFANGSSASNFDGREILAVGPLPHLTSEDFLWFLAARSFRYTVAGLIFNAVNPRSHRTYSFY